VIQPRSLLHSDSLGGFPGVYTRNFENRAPGGTQPHLNRLQSQDRRKLNGVMLGVGMSISLLLISGDAGSLPFRSVKAQ